MSTRYNTGNQIESTDVRDMSDNAKNFDEFSNSMSDSFTDRFGVDRQTMEGAVRKAGFRPASFDFLTGGSLVSGDRNKAVFNPAPPGDNNWYAWQGAFPKIISPNSTPSTSGGLGDNAWKPVTNNILAPTVMESIRRSYADAGYNLVDGSFEAGGTVTTATDVLLYEAEGKAYSYTGTLPHTVSAGSNPSAEPGMWSDRSNDTVGKFNYAQIRGYTGAFSVIDCIGKSVLGDGAQGRFLLDQSDSTSSDNGCTIIVDAAGRRWKRIHSPGTIDLLWATGEIVSGVDYTAEFEAAVRASARPTNGNPLDMRAGTLLLPSCDVLLRNAFVRDPGLVLRGVSNGISRLVGDSAGVTLTVHPVRGDDTPYTNTGYGGLFMYDCQIHAVSDAARSSGIGLLLINCFNTQFINQYVSGFFYNIVLRGSHFAQYRNFYAADEKNSPDNPNEEIFNRGYALAISSTPVNGEFESTGLVIDGGWFHNTSLDLAFGSNYTIKNVDIEPASNTVNLGHKGHIHDCRFERMDYYAISAVPPKYAPFPWFRVIGDGNLIEHNDIHSLGAVNKPEVNPKFLVQSNDNTFIFDKDCIRFGLIKLGPATSGNHVEIGKFNDLEYFKAGAESTFYVENVHIYEGYNTHKLVESRSHVESFFDSYEVKNCASLVMTGPAEVQGLTKIGNAYTVDGSAPPRIVCNFNTTTKYTPGVYCLKFRLTGYSDSINISIAASYLKSSSQSMPMQGMNGGYCFVRFQIVGTEDLVMPTFNINGASAGDSFTLSNVELLKFDSGEYVKNEYVIQ